MFASAKVPWCSKNAQAGLQPRRTDNGGHGPIDRTAGGLVQRALPGGSFDARCRKAQRAQVFQTALMRRHGDLRVELACLLGQAGNVVPTGQRHDVIGVRITPDQVQRAFPDGTGGPENGNLAHVATHVVSAPEEAQLMGHKKGERRAQERIKPIEDTAMAGDQV